MDSAPGAKEPEADKARSDSRLVYPNGLAFDRSGNLFISDIGTHQVLRLDPHGRRTVLAGTGDSGFSSDGGPAHKARLAATSDLVVDGDGNPLVADAFNHRIRRIDARCVITIVVGDG